MRMLIDLFNNEHGYARIFAEKEGFGYELSTYRPLPIADLFTRMSGFASAEAACEAAQQLLASLEQTLQRKVRRSRSSSKQVSARRRASSRRVANTDDQALLAVDSLSA
jgi:hypothetical protein